MVENPNPPKKQHSLKNPKILLRSQIEEAQKHTNSNQAAARWLNVSYLIYKKYAKLYDLFDRHLNVRGVGSKKALPNALRRFRSRIFLRANILIIV